MIYAILDDTQKCVALMTTPDVVESDQHIPIATLDESLLNKEYKDGVWLSSASSTTTTKKPGSRKK